MKNVILWFVAAVLFIAVGFIWTVLALVAGVYTLYSGLVYDDWCGETWAEYIKAGRDCFSKIIEITDFVE